ncbi:DUF547 domain-containing protein [Halobacteriales archaeon QS_9_70_65]|nr:MAG: DUF547 domain-containing protein [Halobacteriales archaeon QS_9_70_65]
MVDVVERESDEDPTTVAADLLVATRAGDDRDPGPHLAALAGYDHDDLAAVRDDRERALAFWINLYNAGTQLLLERRPELYESPLRFVRFFRADAVTVAGYGLGLDAIEQGILRGGRSKYGLGYLPRLPWPFERRYRVDRDPRVHFALNCGAESCPPIRAYDPDRIDDQLDVATASYLAGTVDYDPAAGVVRLPRLFLWYRGDFGGRSGIRRVLREYDAIPADADPKFRYRSWDWSRAAGKFA